MYRLSHFKRECAACKLSGGKAVAGQSLAPPDEVALIVISAYPGTNEVNQNLSLTESQGAASNSMSAGDFLRLTFDTFFDGDPNFPQALKPFRQYVYKSNAIKCMPQRGNVKLNITPAHLKSCRETWLDQELAMFGPTVPILLAAGEAVKSLLGPKFGLYSSRRQLHYFGQHPVIVTFNPIEAERGLLKVIPKAREVEQDLRKLFAKVKRPGKKAQLLIGKTEYWRPAPVGSNAWHFKQDLEAIKEQIIKYHEH